MLISAKHKVQFFFQLLPSPPLAHQPSPCPPSLPSMSCMHRPCDWMAIKKRILENKVWQRATTWVVTQGSLAMHCNYNHAKSHSPESWNRVIWVNWTLSPIRMRIYVVGGLVSVSVGEGPENKALTELSNTLFHWSLNSVSASATGG